MKRFNQRKSPSKQKRIPMTPTAPPQRFGFDPFSGQCEWTHHYDSEDQFEASFESLDDLVRTMSQFECYDHLHDDGSTSSVSDVHTPAQYADPIFQLLKAQSTVLKADPVQFHARQSSRRTRTVRNLAEDILQTAISCEIELPHFDMPDDFEIPENTFAEYKAELDDFLLKPHLHAYEREFFEAELNSAEAVEITCSHSYTMYSPEQIAKYIAEDFRANQSVTVPDVEKPITQTVSCDPAMFADQEDSVDSGFGEENEVQLEEVENSTRSKIHWSFPLIKHLEPQLAEKVVRCLRARYPDVFNSFIRWRCKVYKIGRRC